MLFISWLLGWVSGAKDGIFQFRDEIFSYFVSMRDRLHENGELTGNRLFGNVHV